MQVKLKHEGALNIKSVASQLGVSIQTGEQLVSNGCLPAICTPKLSGFKLWQLPNDAAEHLIAAVRCKIKHRSDKTQNVEVMNYRTVCRRLLGWNVKVSYFIKGILLNKIKPHGETKNGRGLHRFTFLASDLDDYLEPCIAAFYAKRKFWSKTTHENSEFISFRKNLLERIHHSR